MTRRQRTPLVQWLWKKLSETNFDETAAIDRAIGEWEKLEHYAQAIIIRAGVTALMSKVARTARLLIAQDDAPSAQLNLFASVRDAGGHYHRVRYFRLNYDKLVQVAAEWDRQRARLADEVERMKVDLALYAKHRSLATLQDVWDAEGVSYEIEEIAEANG